MVNIVVNTPIARPNNLIPSEYPCAWPESYPHKNPEGCILYYDMQDLGNIMLDHSLRGNSGTINGSVTNALPNYKVIANMKKGDESSGYINCGKNSILNLTGDMSFEFPIMPSGGTWTNSTILDKGTASSRGFKIASLTSSYIRFYTYQSGYANQYTQTAAGALSSTNPSYLVITRSGSSVKIYLNGQDKTGTAGTHIDPTSSVNDNLVLMSVTAGTSSWFNGYLGEFKIYNKCLNPSEALQTTQENAWKYGISV